MTEPTQPALHRRYPRLWGAYHALCARLSVEPIPGHLLDRTLLGNEFKRLHRLALEFNINTDDILAEALK